MHTDRQMIEKLHEKDATASKARDGEAPVISRQTIRSWLEKNLEESDDYKITEYSHDYEEVQILGQWAFEWGTFSAAAKPVTGGPSMRETGKLLRILARQPDGTWKVARSIWNSDPGPHHEE